MRKRIINDEEPETSDHEHWLDAATLARVELTSEEADYPIESALSGIGPGWRAARAGEQRIRLLFDAPLNLRRIRVVFEVDAARTQEFVLRWSSDEGRSFRDAVRQQFTFSPPDTTREVEDYAVDLQHVRHLELLIAPDINGGSARASLKQFRIA